MKTELNLMRNIYGKESAAPRGACLVGILHSRGCAPRCGASPRAIAPAAPPAPDADVQTPAEPLAPNIKAQTQATPPAITTYVQGSGQAAALQGALRAHRITSSSLSVGNRASGLDFGSAR